MNKIALITGASSGIGKEFAKLLAGEGYDLILTARREAVLKELAQVLEATQKIKTYIIASDLSEKDAARTLFNKTRAMNLSVDVLINNAAFGTSVELALADVNKEEQQLQLNVVALALLSQMYAGEMVKQGGGNILNVSSISAFLPGPYMTNYYASKAFVNSFSEALRVELKDKNVTVTALCPGPTETDFFDAAGIGDKPLMKKLNKTSAAKVARLGYKAMLKNKRIKIPGIWHKIAYFSSILPPRPVVTWITGRRQKGLL